jgi:HD-like signal output (HDOD) protein
MGIESSREGTGMTEYQNGEPHADVARRDSPADPLTSTDWNHAAWQKALSGGLPTLPGYVFELNALLSSPQVDLKRVSNIIRTDPCLSANVLRMCNLPWVDGRPQVNSIEEAVLFLGREQLRTLVLTCSLAQQTGGALAPEDLHSFWQHSFLVAMISERLAQAVGHYSPERAYLAGLLHDVGLLALLCTLPRKQGGGEREHVSDLFQNGGWESARPDHCEVGRAIAVGWGFPPDLIEVFEFHHKPTAAVYDPLLVGIVAAADHLTCQRGVVPGCVPRINSLEGLNCDHVFAQCLPHLSAGERRRLSEIIAVEFHKAIPMLEFNQVGVLCYVSAGKKEDKTLLISPS